MGSRRRALLVALVLGVLGPAATAQADTWCVNATGCDSTHDKGSNLQAALTAAEGNAGPDTVKLGATPVTTTTGFLYNNPQPVFIQGSGGRDVGRHTSLISDTSTNQSGHTVLKVLGSAQSTISGLAIGVAAGSGSNNVGIETPGTISNVFVQGGEPPSNSAIGVVLDSGGAIAGSDVQMATTNLSTGVRIAGTGTKVDDSRIEAAVGLETIPSGAVSAVARHLQVTAASAGVIATTGVITIEDALFVSPAGNDFLHLGLNVSAVTDDVSLSLDHVTMIGGSDADFGSQAIKVGAGNGHHAEVSFRNGVFTRFQTAFSGSGSVAHITTDYSDYSNANGSGAGAVTETNHLNVDPGFLSSTDFHLRPDSPLIDAGDPAALASGESLTDVAGQPRIADGDGNCVARRDVGAYEFTPGPRAPKATASSSPSPALPGQPVTFDAAGSCDPDGDSLTYSWTFDDGGGGPGSSIQRSFSIPGPHFGTVTVTDSTGRSTTATASVLVHALPGPLPFAGVRIATQTVKVSKSGAAPVKVGCPAGTIGACTGAVALAGKRGAFAIAPGASHRVSVKLSKSTLKKLRKAKRLTVTASAKAHDANASVKTTTGKITLVAPR